jgi:hypothetical protein
MHEPGGTPRYNSDGSRRFDPDRAARVRTRMQTGWAHLSPEEASARAWRRQREAELNILMGSLDAVPPPYGSGLAEAPIAQAERHRLPGQAHT